MYKSYYQPDQIIIPHMQIFRVTNQSAVSNLHDNRFELGLEKPDPRRALWSAMTIALSYVIGGMVPLFPYMFVKEAHKAMFSSVVVTLLALLFFGFVKGHLTGNRPFLSAVQTTFIGALASAAAYAIAKAVQNV